MNFLPFIVTFNLVSGEYFVPHPEITVTPPKGFKVSVPDDDGIQLFAFHGNINKEMWDLEAGDYSDDILKKENGMWSYKNKQVKIKPGDTLYYWLFVIKNGLGYRYDDGKYVFNAGSSSPTEVYKSPTYAGQEQNDRIVFPSDPIIDNESVRVSRQDTSIPSTSELLLAKLTERIRAIVEDKLRSLEQYYRNGDQPGHHGGPPPWPHGPPPPHTHNFHWPPGGPGNPRGPPHPFPYQPPPRSGPPGQYHYQGPPPIPGHIHWHHLPPPPSDEHGQSYYPSPYPGDKHPASPPLPPSGPGSSRHLPNNPDYSHSSTDYEFYAHPGQQKTNVNHQQHSPPIETSTNSTIINQKPDPDIDVRMLR